MDSVPNSSFIAASVQMEMGLVDRFSLLAGRLSGQGAGETSQKEGVFLSGSGGSFARQLGSTLFPLSLLISSVAFLV